MSAIFEIALSFCDVFLRIILTWLVNDKWKSISAPNLKDLRHTPPKLVHRQIFQILLPLHDLRQGDHLSAFRVMKLSQRHSTNIA